jgi:hypothetical protein
MTQLKKDINLYILSLLFLFATILELYPCNRHHFEIGTNFTSFNNNNQLTFDISKRDFNYLFIEDNSKLNLELGLRLKDFKNPSFIYNFSFFDGNYNYRIEEINKNIDEEDQTDRPGSMAYSSKNKLMGLTILKIDNSKFEDLSLDYAEFRYGYGYCTNTTKWSYGPYVLFGYVIGKLGLSSINIDSLHYAINNKEIFHPVVKTGLTLKTGFSFNEYNNIKADFDYSVYFYEKAIHKFDVGLKYEKTFFASEISNLSGRFKFGIGANYTKFYSPKINNEFININLTFQYFLNKHYIPEFLGYIYEILLPKQLDPFYDPF